MSMEVQQFLNDTGGNFTEMAPRPPVPGEETAELQSNGGISTRSSGSHKSHLSGKSHSSGKSASSHRSDVSHSPAATPRRSNLDKTLTCTSVGCSEPKPCFADDDEAPLGFEPEGSAANSPQFTENSTPPYLKWAENIKFLLDDSDGVKLFKQYLDQDTCSGLLDFWFACKGLKMVDEDDTDRINRVSKLIYKKYIKGDQLTLRPDIKKSIVDRLKQSDVHQSIFDEAQTEVELMMKNDAYPQFLKSDIYLQYVQNGGESPKTSNNSSGSSSARPLSGPLPTVIEGEELCTDNIKRSSAPALPLTQATLFNTRRSREAWNIMNKERTVNTSMFTPFTPSSGRLPNPYHVSYTTVSAQDSELQSLSSDALTDDTISLTDSSVDGRDLSCYGKKAWKKQMKTMRRYADVNKQTQPGQTLIPRTERAPKDRNLAEKEPEKFAAILCEKLMKVKEELDKLERVKANLQNCETDEESDSAKMAPPTSIPAKVSVPPPPANPLNMLLALANKDSEDNAQSILEEHCSRVWDNSNGQTPSRSPGRHSPKSWVPDPNNSIRYPYAPGPSPNVSASTLFPTHNKSHTRRKDKDPNVVSSYDSGMGVEDKGAGHYQDNETRHKFVYHHHHHHHHVMKDGNKSRVPDPDAHNRSLHYHLSAPTLPNFNNDSSYGPHRTHNSHNRSTWEDPSRTPRPKDSKRSAAKKGLDSSSNIDSGVGLTPDTNTTSVPNANDPANEKVIAWMLENEKVSTGNTQYSTDGSDKASSNKRSSHKSSNTSQHKSTSSSGKKTQPQFNTSRSGSLDRSGYNSFHQPVGADYSWTLEGGVQPGQPFAQDPSMPLLNPPNSMTQLEEVKRRLEDESSKARMRQSKSFTGISSSSSTSRDRRVMPPPPHSGMTQRNTSSYARNIPQVAPLDLSSSEDHSSSHGSHKSESKRSAKKSSSVPTTPGQQGDSTVIGYYFCHEPIPYRTSLPGKQITLAQFKQLISKKGNYRYFFKSPSDEFDSGVVHEEIQSDNQVLPLWEGKIVGKVEKKE